jgi:F0F1-type ATP synthase gamma subunit
MPRIGQQSFQGHSRLGLPFQIRGRKTMQFLSRTKYPLLIGFSGPVSRSFRDLRSHFQVVFGVSARESRDFVPSIYKHFDLRTFLKADITHEKVSPWIHTDVVIGESRIAIFSKGYQVRLFEQDIGQITDHMARISLIHNLHQALLEEKASEHSVDMIAMKNTTDNGAPGCDYE